ncbi:MAG: hypothetical protein SF123_09640 [Chloroflexota bacterium]|nr:hypothetical protein [Chloroflexota bacterium]
MPYVLQANGRIARLLRATARLKAMAEDINTLQPDFANDAAFEALTDVQKWRRLRRAMKVALTVSELVVEETLDEEL